MSARAVTRRLRTGLLATSVLAFSPFLAHADEPTSDSDPATLSQVVVEARRADHASAATGLDLTLRETPQSVTVISNAEIRDFALNTTSDLLALVTGVNVEKVETDRTYFNARGFDITNFQVDGVGLPLPDGIQTGSMDTALFDRVEVVRGANGMLSGTGNPSATVNYVRKRPTKGFMASADVSYGSWNDRRLGADVSGPLNRSGTVTGRLVYANEDKDSYLDFYKVNRNVYYGVLAWEVTPALTLTGGYARQDNPASGVLWGALPLDYSDGTRIRYPSSASTSADWTYWDTHSQNAFLEAAYALGAGWKLKGTYNYKRTTEQAKLLYAFGNPDPQTGLGVAAMTGRYPSKTSQNLWDASLTGPVPLFGRNHEVVVGASTARSINHQFEAFADTYPDYPPISQWGRVQIAEPVYPEPYLAALITDRLNRFYAAAHLDFSDRLKGVVGFNAVNLKTQGSSYGVDQARSESKVSPYAGLVFDITRNVSAYASYTDIFNPQAEVDVTNARLAAAKGESYEAGLKSEWFDRRLYATAAVFKSNQSGLAEFAGTFDDGKSYYRGVDTEAKGYELEVSGAVTPQWRIGGGWTDLLIKNPGGENVRLYLPRRTLKLTTTYSIPELRDLKLGAALRWQDDISTVDIAEIRQQAYAVLDLTAALNLTPRVRATVNVNNLLDDKHLTSLMWDQAYYDAPRSVSLRLGYSF